MIDFVIDEALWEHEKGVDVWRSGLEAILVDTLNSQDIQRASLSLMLTNSDAIKKLNQQFRHVDKSTNVLSFPQYESRLDVQDGAYIGDIAMSLQDIKKESEEYHINFFDRCSHLFVHGVLHLLGWDHVDEDERSRMETFEIKILSKFGIRNPYIADY